MMFEELLYNQTLQIEWNKLGADEFIKQSSLCTDLSYEHNIKELINKDSMFNSFVTKWVNWYWIIWDGSFW